MSSNIITPQVSLSEIRGEQIAGKLKNTTAADKPAKIQKSSRDFEAVLLSHWLEQAEKSFATVPGSNEDPNADPGRDQYLSMAMQAVATSISGTHGGLGIATMVAKHLQAQTTETEPANSMTLKPLHGEPVPIKSLTPHQGTERP